MDPDTKSSFRRRTCSFAGSATTYPTRDEQQPVPPRSVDDTDPPPVHYVRFRRASFALTGERTTTLDGLVDSASQQAISAAANREAATITSIVSPVGGSAEGFESSEVRNCDTSTHDEFCKRVSVATIVPSVSHFPTHHDHSVSGSSSAESAIQPVTSSNQTKDVPFVWYNAADFPSNPLSSELVMKYLAALAVDGQSARSVAVHASPNIKSFNLVGEDFPGLLPLASSSVASMTLPVRQVRRAHIKSAVPVVSNPALSSSHDHAGFLYPPVFPKRGLQSECPYSSGISDTEGWHGWNLQGYASDNPMADASLDSKQMRVLGHRFDSEFNRSMTSLPVRSPKKTRLRSRGHETDVDGTLFPGTTPSSPRSSKFDLSHVYDGLPSVSARDSKMSTSTCSLNLEFQRQCLTPPSTPNSLSSKSSTCHSAASLHGIQRLRSLLDQLKPHLPDEDAEKYIYMDEETRARRAKAQASNVILPVSF